MVLPLLAAAGDLLVTGGILSPDLAAAGAIQAGAMIGLATRGAQIAGRAAAGGGAPVDYAAGPYPHELAPYMHAEAGATGPGDLIDIGGYNPAQHTGCGVGTKPSPGGEGCIPCGANERPIPGAASGCEPIPAPVQVPKPGNTRPWVPVVPARIMPVVAMPLVSVTPNQQPPTEQTPPAPAPPKSNVGAIAAAGCVLALLYFGRNEKKRRGRR